MNSDEQAVQALPELLSATTVDQVKALCQRLVSGLGLDFFLLGFERSCPGGKSEFRIETNYPAAWMERYARLQWMPHDPVVQHCRQSSLPLVWHRARFTSQHAQHLFEESAAYGVSAGVATALRGAGRRQPMMMAVACDEHANARTEAWLLNMTPTVHLLSAYAYEALCRIEESADTEHINLTRREQECLRWAAAGKTSWEISFILKCSEGTVNFHVRNVIKKLDVANRRQAVARALSLGLIAG